MILLIAVILGLVAGLLRAHLVNVPYRPLQLRHIWLVFVAYLPQFFAFYLPATKGIFPDIWVPATLIGSQLLLLVFAWKNRTQPGFWLLGLGLFLNFLVTILNGGMMPISPETATALIPPGVSVNLVIGERVGAGKDILLPTAQTTLWFLSDCFILPGWLHNRLAFSFGDILISMGAFWLFWSLGSPHNITLKESKC